MCSTARCRSRHRRSRSRSASPASLGPSCSTARCRSRRRRSRSRSASPCERSRTRRSRRHRRMTRGEPGAGPHAARGRRLASLGEHRGVSCTDRHLLHTLALRHGAPWALQSGVTVRPCHRDVLSGIAPDWLAVTRTATFWAIQLVVVERCAYRPPCCNFGYYRCRAWARAR